MWVLDILNLNRRKLNHHEEVYSQEAIPEAAYREQELGRSARTASADGQPASGATAVVDDRTGAAVDRGHVGPIVSAIR